MRTLLFIAFLVFAGDASAQFFCTGCGCKGGSGWRHIASGKCIGCAEMPKRCREKDACAFEGQAHITLVCASCRSHVPAMMCPLK